MAERSAWELGWLVSEAEGRPSDIGSRARKLVRSGLGTSLATLSANWLNRLLSKDLFPDTEETVPVLELAEK